jgi:hypothetical protein
LDSSYGLASCSKGVIEGGACQDLTGSLPCSPNLVCMITPNLQAFRMTFATALPEKMEEAIARVGRVLARAAATATAS